MANTNLNKAQRQKADEFYTQLADIENEMRHYRPHFKGKTIFCNCDDPYESNFFKYFAMNFNYLGLKKLIATCYDGSPIAGDELPLFETLIETTERKHPYKIEITEVKDENGDGAVDLADVEYLLRNRKNTLSILSGNGDFRSEECVALLEEADIVVTNPPFSLFREYVAQLVQYQKDFIILGNKNSITYKEIFLLIKQNLIRTGFRNINQDMWFIVPPEYKCEKVINGKRVKHIPSCWYTTLPVNKHNDYLNLYKKYNSEEFPHYDNYDAINVDKTEDIPYDYDGIMGVPITFLDKYNPNQFEILGITKRNDDPYKIKYYTIKDYPNANDLNRRGVIIVDGKPQPIYARLLIRRKDAVKNEN